LSLAEDFVVFIRRDITVMQRSNDRAVRERKLPFTIGVDRCIVARTLLDC